MVLLLSFIKSEILYGFAYCLQSYVLCPCVSWFGQAIFIKFYRLYYIKIMHIFCVYNCKSFPYNYSFDDSIQWKKGNNHFFKFQINFWHQNRRKYSCYDKVQAVCTIISNLMDTNPARIATLINVYVSNYKFWFTLSSMFRWRA